MWIRIIFLLVAVCHTCSPTVNDTVSLNRTSGNSHCSTFPENNSTLQELVMTYNCSPPTEPKHEDLKENFFSDFLFPEGINCSLPPGCKEEDNYSLDFTDNNCSLASECYGPGSFYVVDDCNSTLDGEERNCSLSVSDKAELFLKGLTVTRFMPSFYILIILISLPLNALALVTFTCRIREKKPAVIYMSHLACVDLLFALLLPLKIHYQLNASNWVFGEGACRVLTAAYYCYMYCSILLMMCMSVDRLLAVAFPVASLTLRSTRKAMCICVLVWLLALAGTVPLLSMRQSVEIKNIGVTCHDALHHNDPTEHLYLYLFFILSCLYYFVPLVVTLVNYSIIIYVLSVKSNRLTSSSSSSKRRRAVIMAVSVLTEFVVCFAPTNGILLYHCALLATGGKNSEGDSSYAAYLVAVCLGSASVFLDPLLYYYGSSQCRQKIQSVLRRRTAGKPTTPCNTAVTKSRPAENCKV